MREKLHTAVCMVLILVVFTGCRGMGGALKIAFAVGYIALRTAAVAAASRHGSSDTERLPATPEVSICGCRTVPHGSTWCEQNQDGADQCAIECEPGFVYRDGICAQESTFSRAAAVQSLDRAIDSAQECRVAAPVLLGRVRTLRETLGGGAVLRKVR